MSQQAQIGAIVHELAEDLDGVGGRFAFSGDDLRHRRAEQVACRLCPLTWPAARRGNPA